MGLLAPTSCVGCGRDGAALCRACQETCGSEREVLALPETELAGVVVGAFYDGAVKELIWKLKFFRLWAAADVCAELVVAALPEGLMVDVVTSVPVAPARYRERGYNQSELVARAVARRLRVRYSSLLGRHNVTHQLGKTRAMRLDQIRGAFYGLRVAAGRVLVVDDVVTTGATLAECAAALKVLGAETVWGAAVARH